jgi:formamidopyrimidine-DNA glycosylase
MTGLVFLSSPPNDAHLRLIVELEVTAPGSPEQFLFWDQRGLGVVRLVTPFEYDRHYGPNKVGPDAMVADADTLRERFGESSRAIKVALLDQRALAGIGNLYASEILHLAQISPVKRCNGLTREEWHRLCDSMRRVLSDAIEHQGSTLKDGTYRIAHDEPGNYQFSHRVYQRAGKRCNSCGKGEIVRMVQAQRSTFFCPKCQPTRRGSRRRGEA